MRSTRERVPPKRFDPFKNANRPQHASATGKRKAVAAPLSDLLNTTQLSDYSSDETCPFSESSDYAATALVAERPRAVLNDGGGSSSTVTKIRAGAASTDASSIVRLRLPRCMMPYRWAEPLPPFVSCLDGLSADAAAAAVAASGLPPGVLHGALHGDEVAEQSWLTSAFMDLAMAQFARAYPGSRFMPAEFAAFGLRGATSAASACDVLGRPIDYSSAEPFLLLVNVRNHHWNLLRAQIAPYPELQLFEPMGKPAKRGSGPGGNASAGGLSARHMPADVLRWLDSAYPLDDGAGGWQRRSFSAVTRQQQTTGFDCGVAALLYAEKCGQGQVREDIDAYTTQDDLTMYRTLLQRFSESLSAAQGR